MKFEPVKFKHTTIPIKDIKKRSKNFYNFIKKRRSIREFSLRNFDDEIIKSAIKSAGTAPNGANLQPWHFVVIKDKKIKKEIRKAAEKEEKRFYNKVAPIEWLDALKPLGTDEKKQFLDLASKHNWILFLYHDPEVAAIKIEKDKKYYKVIDELRRKRH